jgi:hypothetical protein
VEFESGGGEGVSGGPWDGEFCFPMEPESMDGEGVRSWAAGAAVSSLAVDWGGCCLRENSPKTISANFDRLRFGFLVVESKLEVIELTPVRGPRSPLISSFPRQPHAFVTLLARANPPCLPPPPRNAFNALFAPYTTI